MSSALTFEQLSQQLTTMQAEALSAIETATDLDALEGVRISFLGRKEGRLTDIKRGVKDLPDADRPKVGALANEVSAAIESQLDQKLARLKQTAMDAQLKSEALDVTMPGVYRPAGTWHPLSQVTREIIEIFYGLGYQCIDDDQCPEVETDHYNFEALNFPPDHPARDMQDTFYTDVAPNVLLRSQTSNNQIHYMEEHKPPIKVIAPGRVYRNEAVSSRKSVLFHQLEGLLIDDKTTFADLKGTLHQFIKLFFGEERPTRFRNSFFPFTEPSAEMDIQCSVCHGQGCRTCGYHGWLEILGAGMVDPNVLEGVGIDSERYIGFAFGMGLERLVMLKYAINDLRLLYDNRLAFLKQFRGQF